MDPVSVTMEATSVLLLAVLTLLAGYALGYGLGRRP